MEGGGARRNGSHRRRSRNVSSRSASACRATSPTDCRARGSGQRRKGIGHPNRTTAVGDHRAAAALSPVPRPVVFDVDGVLVDSEPLYEPAFRVCMGSVGWPGARRAVLDHARSATGRVRARAAEPLGLSPAEICDGLDAAAEALMEAELVGMPHTRAAVERVAAGDRRAGLASSSSRAFIDRVLQILGIAERFATIASGDEVARGKPYPEIYRLAASRLEVAPQHWVAIGDTRLASAPPRRLPLLRSPCPTAIFSELDEAAALILTLDTS
jgi:beta-phosphoglucomutase-like phosphatase (HAD superfamily)